MKNKALLFVLAFILLMVGIVIGFYFAKNPLSIKLPDFEKKEIQKKQGWLTYENKELGFTFDYPETYNLFENDTSAIIYINLDDGLELLTLQINKNSSESFYSSLPTTKVSTFNNVDWNFQDSAEYCDGGECNTTNPGYTTIKNGILFTLILAKPNARPTSAIEILSTFRFL